MAFTRRGGRSPERAQRGKEAPAAADACPRKPTVIETPRGVAEGAEEGAQHHTEYWLSQYDRKSGAGRGFAAPAATDIRAFPPGG